MKLSEFKAQHMPWSAEFKARVAAEKAEEDRLYQERVKAYQSNRYMSYGGVARPTPAAPPAPAAPAASSSGSDFLMGALVGNALSSLMHASEASSSRRSSDDSSSSSSVFSRSESSSSYDSSSSSDWGSSSSSDWSSD